MLNNIFLTGLQLTQVIGLGCFLLGVLVVIGGFMTGRGLGDVAKGAVLMVFGFYVAGWGQHFL